jgi:hypothetical protein
VFAYLFEGPLVLKRRSSDIAERRSGQCGHYQVVAIKLAPGEVTAYDFGYWDGGSVKDECVQLRFLAYHPPFVEKEAQVVRWGNAKNKPAQIAIYPVGSVVHASTDGGETKGGWVRIDVGDHYLRETIDIQVFSQDQVPCAPELAGIILLAAQMLKRTIVCISINAYHVVSSGT